MDPEDDSKTVRFERFSERLDVSDGEPILEVDPSKLDPKPISMVTFDEANCKQDDDDDNCDDGEDDDKDDDSDDGDDDDDEHELSEEEEKAFVSFQEELERTRHMPKCTIYSYLDDEGLKFISDLPNTKNPVLRSALNESDRWYENLKSDQLENITKTYSRKFNLKSHAKAVYAYTVDSWYGQLNHDLRGKYFTKKEDADRDRDHLSPREDEIFSTFRTIEGAVHYTCVRYSVTKDLVGFTGLLCEAIQIGENSQTELLYRGINMKFNARGIGSLVVFRSFVSTTKRKSVAEFFAQDNGTLYVIEKGSIGGRQPPFKI